MNDYPYTVFKDIVVSSLNRLLTSNRNNDFIENSFFYSEMTK